MTEKRFTIGDRALQEVYAGCIPAILDGGIPCTQSQVLKLLNELNDEKEFWKGQVMKLQENSTEETKLTIGDLSEPVDEMDNDAKVYLCIYGVKCPLKSMFINNDDELLLLLEGL